MDRPTKALVVVVPCNCVLDRAHLQIHVMNVREIAIETLTAKATLSAFKGAGMYQFLGVRAMTHPGPTTVSIHRISD